MTLQELGFNEFQERILFPEIPRQSTLDIKTMFPFGGIPIDRTSLDFISSTISGTSHTQTTASTSYTDITGLSLDFEIAEKTYIVLLWQATAYAQGQWTDTNRRVAIIRLVVDDVQVGDEVEVSGTPFGNPTVFTIPDMIMLHYIQQFTAGRHTAKLQIKTNNAGYEAVVFNSKCRISYIKLG